MVAPIYSNRKGIYQDLYREIDSDNKKKTEYPQRSPKGIYVNLYNQIGDVIFQGIDERQKETLHNNALKVAQKLVNGIYSKISFVFSTVNAEFKMFILAFMVARQPINNYINDNIPNY